MISLYVTGNVPWSVSPGLGEKLDKSNSGKSALGLLALLLGLYRNSASEIILTVLALFCALLTSDLILVLARMVPAAPSIARIKRSLSSLLLGSPLSLARSLEMMPSLPFWIKFNKRKSFWSVMISDIISLLRKIQSYILNVKDNKPVLTLEEKPLTPLQELEAFLLKWDSSTMPSIYSSDMSAIQVPVFAKNGTDTSLVLRVFIGCLKEDSRIPKVLIEEKIRWVYLRDFFVDEFGMYEDVYSCMKEMRELTLTLINLYNEKEKTEQTDNNSFYNRILLGQVNQSLITFYSIFKQ